jgi:hypothetical protein
MRQRWARGLRGDDPNAAKEPISHLEILGKTNTLLGVEHLSDPLVE